MAILIQIVMKKICLVTYTRNGEHFTNELNIICNTLSEKYGDSFKLVICCESELDISKKDYDIELFKSSGTKYKRLINLMHLDDSKYYLSIDNDIKANCDNLLFFLDNIFLNDYDIGWGTISAQKQKGLISNLVIVDKLISHKLIRPFLWKLGIGISVPGQIFCIKGSTFRDKLLKVDTFLDDLALGLYININKSRKFITTSNLGEERPNSKFIGLISQRKRWAIGFSTLYKGVRSIKGCRSKLIVHAIAYHLTWFFNWILIFTLLIICWPISIVCILLEALFLSIHKPNMYFYTIIYLFIFPIFHIAWIITLIHEFLKGANY